MTDTMTDTMAVNGAEAGPAPAGINLARVPDVEKRLALKPLLARCKELEEQREAAVSPLEEERDQKLRELDERRRQLRDEYGERIDAMGQAFDAQIKGIDAEIDALSGDIIWLDDGDPDLCAMTGLVLFESDEVLEDPETLEKVLRLAILRSREAEEEVVEGEVEEAAEHSGCCSQEPAF